MTVKDMTQVSIDLNDSENLVNSAQSVHVAKEGKVQSKAYDVTRDCTVHKEMERTGFYNLDKKAAKEKEPLLKGKESNPDNKFAVQTLTADDFEVLESEGIYADKSSSSYFDREIQRIKKDRASRQEYVDRKVEQMTEERRQMERSVIMSAVKGTVAEKMLRRLSDANLPATTELACSLAGAADMSATAKELSSGGINNLIEQASVITPEKVGQSNYIKKPRWNDKPDGFESMKLHIEDILKSAGIMESQDWVEFEKGIEAAKYLFENHLPVTMENIRCYESITELQGLETDVLIDRIIDGVIDGLPPEKTDLTYPSRNEAAELIEQLQEVSEENIHRNGNAWVDPVTAKRQLEEIRLRLTIDAARDLKGKGLKIDTMQLTEVVEGLREREKEIYEDLLKEKDAPVTKENVEILRDTFSLKEQALTAPSYILGRTLSKGMRQTLKEFAEEGVSAKRSFPDLEKVYEMVGTEVRKDLGDSIQKAFANIDSILGELELPDTANNKRAVRILAYNRMDITRESISDIKEYDSKVNHLLHNITPAAVTSLVKEKINPMEMPMEELAEILKNVSVNQLPGEESFRKFLWKLDKKGGLTEAERKSIVGIYRLLDKVEKSDGSVIGSLVKQGREITLNSLLSAVRTEKKGGVQAEVGDEFGGLQEVVAKGISISDQISAVFGESVVSDLCKALSPKKLIELGDDAMTMPVDFLLEKCMEEQSEKKEYYQMRADEIRLIKEAANDAESFLEKCKIPNSIQNISMAKAYLENGLEGKKPKWKKEDSDKIKESFGEPEVLEESYLEVEEVKLEEIKEEMDKAESFNEIQNLRQMSQSISFYRTLRESEIYEVPLVTEKGVTLLNVTIERSPAVEDGKGSHQSGTVQIRMESQEFGRLHASFKLNKKELSGFITSEEEGTLSQGREIFENMKQELSDNGYQVKDIVFVKGSRESARVGEPNGKGTSLKSLYQIARIFIAAVS